MIPADVIPHGSNIYDAAIVLILALMGYAQLRLRDQQRVAKDRANHAAVKAEATQAALPEDQRRRAQEAEQEIHAALEANGAEVYKNVPGIGYYP